MEKKIRSVAVALTVLFVALYVGASSIKTRPIEFRALELPKFVKPNETPTYREDDIDVVPLATAAPEEVSSGAGFVVDQNYVIEFETSEKMQTELTDRQRLDQYRDWLLMTVVTNLDGLTQEQVNQILFDLPPTRYNYMQEFGRFEYGVTRTLMLPDNAIIALIPAEATASQRTDDIGEMVDYHRKNTNTKPVSAQVFSYTIAEDEAILTYNGPQDLAEYFTAATGYVEMSIKTAQDLETFLAQTDTLVSVQQTASGLVFGGRKRQSGDYRGLTIEDVSALYNSQAAISQEQIAFQDKWNKEEGVIIAAANTALKRIPSTSALFGEPTTQAVGDQAYQDAQQRAADLMSTYPIKCGPRADAVNFPGTTTTMARWQAELTTAYTWLICEQYVDQRAAGLVNASGFSLDPAYDYDDVYDFYEDNQDLFAELIENLPPDYIGYVTRDEVTLAGQAIKDRNVNPLLNLVADFSDVYLKLESPYLSEVYTLSQDVQELAFQAARYDGTLEGTEVGMVLFYTDLLAKLWAIDFNNQSPDCDSTLLGPVKSDDDCFADFNSLPDRRVAKIYEQEMAEISYTRLWFGTRDDGFQLTDKGILFAHTATRVYAASSNPLRPGQEVAPNALSASFLGWWNDHYAEIADYEPEYQRLNEIMKWSTVLGWLFTDVNVEGRQTWVAPARERTMSYLSKIDFDTTYWFPDWVHDQPDLRFDLWDKIDFYPDGYADIETESLPRLWGILSPYTQDRWGGGVSLAEPELFAQTARQLTGIADDLVVAPMQRSYLNYADDLLENGFRTLDGAEYQFTATAADEIALLNVSVPNGTKLRGLTSELASVSATPTIVETSPTFGRALQQGDNWASIATTFEDVPIGNLNISETGNGFRVGWESLDVDLSQQLALKLSDSTGDPLAVLASAPEVKTVVDMGDNVLAVRLEGSDQWLRMTPETTPSLDIPSGWQSRAGGFDEASQNWLMAWDDSKTIFKQDDVLQLSQGESTLKRISDVPANASRETLMLNGEAVPIYKTPNGDAYVLMGELPEHVRANPESLPPLLGGGDGLPIAAAPDLPTDNPLFDIVLKNDQDAFVKRLIDAPEQTLQDLDTVTDQFIGSIDGQIAVGDYSAAQQTVRTIKRFQPNDARVYVREALIELEFKNPARAVDALSDMGPVSRITEADVKLLDEFALRGGQGGANELPILETILWQYEGVHSVGTDKLIPFLEKGVIKLGLKTSAKFEGAAVTHISESVDTVWIMDHPSLNDIASLDTGTLNQMISDGEVRVYTVLNDDIANYRPTRVTTADDVNYLKLSLSEEAASASQTSSLTEQLSEGLQNTLNTAMSGGGGGGDETCRDNDPRTECEKQDTQVVYIIEPVN